MAFTYEIDSYSNANKKSHGHLVWGTKKYAAVSGHHGLGTVPKGSFTVKTRNVVTGDDMEHMYCVTDTEGKLCYFIPLEPDFQTTRSGFGIHPDGNVAGSEGCIVLAAPAHRKFWTAWMDTAMNDRPTSLTVKDA